MANSAFQARLREARLARGYSQTDLAKMADLAPGQVNRYEAGKNVPRLHVIGRLAASLGVHPEWLHLGEGPRETGSTTAHSKRLDVITTPTPDGGMEIGFAMSEDLHSFYAKWAEREGLSMNDLIMRELMRRMDDPGEKKPEPDIDEIARRVKELIQAEDPKP